MSPGFDVAFRHVIRGTRTAGARGQSLLAPIVLDVVDLFQSALEVGGL